jgi:two-component system cell cycle response regulator DivK
MTAKILYVEDDATSIRLVRRMLAHSQYEIREATSGSAGLAIAEREHPDLILMDVNLPDVDGLEIVRRIKANPALAETPIIALTSNDRAHDQHLARIAGCDGYIAKPVSRIELLKTIQRYLPYISSDAPAHTG